MPKRRSINEINNTNKSQLNSSQYPAYGKHSAYSYGQTTSTNQQFDAQVQPKQKMSTKKKVVIALSIVLAVILASGTAFALYVNSINKKLRGGTKTDAELTQINDALGGYNTNFKEPFYMLLIGNDARKGETVSRTDTNVVVRVDPKTYTVSMISIPRDTKVEIPGYGVQKFNAAYAFGQAPGVINAAEKLLGVEISHYAEVNFAALSGLVDAVGGVTVENESVIDNYKCDDGDGNHYVIPKGTVTLNGGQALTFARNRDYPTGDYVRAMHQRALIQAIVEKITSTSVTNIPAIIEAAANSLTTDIALNDLIGLAQAFAFEKKPSIYSAVLPSYPQNINGISFVIVDDEKAKEMLELFKAGKEYQDIVSYKSAADVYTEDVDTSNTLVLETDNEVLNGTASANSSATIAGSSSVNADISTENNSINNSGTTSKPTTPGTTTPGTGTSQSGAGGTGTGTGAGTGTGTGTNTGTGTTNTNGAGGGQTTNGTQGTNTGLSTPS